jgi:hypothetical protein
MNAKHKRFFLFILAVACFLAPALAQETEINGIKKFITKKRVNAAYVMFGLNHMGASTLNDFLYTRGHPTVVSDYLSLGFGGHIIHNKLVLGFEVVKLFEKESATVKEFNTAAGAKYSVLNFGYLAHSKKGLMYYPYLGVGLGELKLRIRENSIDSFEDFTGAQKGSESKRRNSLVNVGGALDYFHKYNPKKKGKNSLMMGIRAGYLFSPWRFKWRVNHVAVPDGPNSGISGFYIRFVLGLGGYIENLIKVAIS